MDKIEREMKLAASAEEVFAYLTDPEKLQRWQASSAEVDLRVGGSYSMVIAGEHVAKGTFLEIDPPRKVAYTFGWENSEVVAPGATRIDISLEQDGDFTILRFVHSGLPSAEEIESHTKGWTHYLTRLEIAASGGDPGPDPMA